MRVPRTINVTRYVTPLREGGSLPAMVEADDDGCMYWSFVARGRGRKRSLRSSYRVSWLAQVAFRFLRSSSRTLIQTWRGRSQTLRSTRSFTTVPASTWHSTFCLGR